MSYSRNPFFEKTRTTQSYIRGIKNRSTAIIGVTQLHQPCKDKKIHHQKLNAHKRRDDTNPRTHETKSPRHRAKRAQLPKTDHNRTKIDRTRRHVHKSDDTFWVYVRQKFREDKCSKGELQIYTRQIWLGHCARNISRLKSRKFENPKWTSGWGWCIEPARFGRAIQRVPAQKNDGFSLIFVD